MLKPNTRIFATVSVSVHRIEALVAKELVFSTRSDKLIKRTIRSEGILEIQG